MQIILPAVSEDSLALALREITQYLYVNDYPIVSGGLGGMYGYGSDFENEVFMMHPYCWCDQEECPWCGGCQLDFEELEHLDSCYQWLVCNDLVKEGFTLVDNFIRPYTANPSSMHWRKAQDIQNQVRKKWCQHFGLSFPTGSAVHCTCGATKVYTDCECDFCKATGPFGEKGAEPKKGAPNFWHKPSGLKVWWYKYIGRSMEVHNPNNVDLLTVLNDCINSLQQGGESV